MQFDNFNPTQTFLGAYLGGLGAGQNVQQMSQQTALSDIYQQQGPGLARGDPGAIDALSRVAPDQAAGFQQQRLQMENTRQQMRIRGAELAAKQGEAETARAVAEIDGALSAATAAYRQGPDAFATWSATNAAALEKAGLGGVPYAQFVPAVSAVVGLREGLADGAKMSADLLDQGSGSGRGISLSMGPDGTMQFAQGPGVAGGSATGLPRGYAVQTDADGNVIGAAPIPGTPDAVKAQAAAEKRTDAEEQKMTTANLVLDEIDIALTLIDQNPSWTTGLVGGVAGMMDWTKAGALKNRLATIKANIGFDKLQAMRAASPTGGALGAVSDFENRLLQAVFGSLEQSQNAEDLTYNLKRIRDLYWRVINEKIPDEEARALYRQEILGDGAGPVFTPVGDEAAPTGGPAIQQQPTSATAGGAAQLSPEAPGVTSDSPAPALEIPPVPDGVDADMWPRLFENMTPAERELFK